MHKFLIIILFGWASQTAFAFQQTDSLKIELEEVVVVGYESNRSIMETPASISTIKADQLYLFDNSSLLSGVNSLPGIRIEERAPGSYRVSIRGSSLRSPFGVRNVKVYWNGIPFTEPTGSTALNLLDMKNVNSIEVLKGPAGSMYGAGNGGVLLLNSFASTPHTQITSAGSVGSYGDVRYSGSYLRKMKNGTLQYRYAKQKLDGYRDQSFLDRETVEANGRFIVSSKSLVQLNLLYSNIYYGIPGGLNEAQFTDNPRQARAGSVGKNSSISHESMNLGATLEYEILPKVKVINSVYASLSSFDNPFLFDYKKESRKSGGLRSRMFYSTRIADVATKFTVGTEMQIGETSAQNYGNQMGKVSSLNFDDDIRIKSALYFGSAEFDLKENLFITVGASLNMLRYDFDRLVTNIVGDTTGFYEKKFNPQFIPRIGLVNKITPNMSIHGSISFGFSPPTVEEVRTNEGSLNLGLAPEKGTSYEIGMRGNFLRARIKYDASFFYFRLKDAIVQQQTPRGTNVFINAGSANQAGFELSTSILLLDNPAQIISQIELNNALTINRFYFDEYETNSGDFSGNKLTGVAPNISTTTFTVKAKGGLYSSAGHYFTDEIPLNDANSFYSNKSHVVKLTAGFKRQLLERLTINVSFSLDNLLNEEYSLGYDINAFGARYYQPAPARNWFGGLKLIYDF